jgi:hypothetical protein
MGWTSTVEGNEIINQLETQTVDILRDFLILEIQEDLFRGLYEELVKKTTRRERGEFFTPDWLALAIIEGIWQTWWDSNIGSRKTMTPQFLDPACGSGTFIFNLVKHYYKKVNKRPTEDNYLVISGFDINPVAVYTSRINYILALPPLVLFAMLENKPNFYLDIIVRDSLENEMVPNSTNGHKLGKKFDIVFGNPPWSVLRSIKSKDYQNYLKKEFIRFNLIASTDVHLFTQLDVATLFFAKCSENFLSESGKIAFVMPKSVLTGAEQHKKFRAFIRPQMRLDEIWDLQGISPLFYMPTCVLFATKGKETQYPVQMMSWKGQIPKNGANLDILREEVTVSETNYSPPLLNMSKSWYFDKFKVGLSIFPRNLYFVKIIEKKDPLIEIETDPEIRRLSKPRWNSVFLKGKTSTEYLFVTLLSWEMFNFGHNRLRWVILPLSLKNDKESSYIPTNLDELKQRDKNAYNWFEKADRSWTGLSTEKSKIRFPTLLSRLNYNNLISYQSPDRRYVVLYSGTGTNLTSCVIDKTMVKPNQTKISPQFITDVKTWFHETNDMSEAHYLCAVFNSNVLNKLIKPLQPQGLGGGRAIHRRALSFPIPKYNPNDPLHKELAELSIRAHNRFINVKYPKTGTMRKQARKQVLDLLPDLDRGVNELLTLS